MLNTISTSKVSDNIVESLVRDRSGLLTEAIRLARLRLLQVHFEKRMREIAGNLGCLDILMTAFHGVLDDADAFVVSEGYAGTALAVTLNSIGKLTDSDLDAMVDPSSIAGVDGVVFTDGVDGHGLALANGIALARTIRRQSGRVYCLVSDIELQDGATLEALAFTTHQNLPVTVIVDAGGVQGSGSTAEIAGNSYIARLQGFGVEPHICNGHEARSIIEACVYPLGVRLVLADTIKGYGVSFMENRWEWQHLLMDRSHYMQAVNEILAAGSTYEFMSSEAA